MNHENNNLGTNLLVFLAGAAVGAAVVALTTPKTGPELRKDINDLGHKLKDHANRLRGKCGCKEEEDSEEGGHYGA